MKKILYIMFFSAIGLVSCEKDEITRPDSSLWEQAETSEKNEGSDLNLNIGTDLFQMKIDETKSFAIAEGNGEYRVTILDTEIAEATVEGDAVKVTGKKQGVTEAVISDKNQNYKSVKVDVYLTDNLIIDQTEVNIELPFGKPAVKIINVTEGNGNYVVSSANGEIATATVDESVPNRITINATAEGETELAITDCHGLSAKVSVKVKINNSAFSTDELNSIMSKTEEQYVLWPDNDFKKKPYNMLRAKNSDLNSSIYFGDKGLKHTGIYQSGTGKTALTVAFENDIDYSLDKEESGYLYERNNSWTFEYNKVPCTFKVIKKENSKCWAVFYAHIGEEIVKGYMIFN